jgi:hypothetical protein
LERVIERILRQAQDSRHMRLFQQPASVLSLKFVE